MRGFIALGWLSMLIMLASAWVSIEDMVKASFVDVEVEDGVAQSSSREDEYPVA